MSGNEILDMQTKIDLLEKELERLKDKIKSLSKTENRLRENISLKDETISSLEATVREYSIEMSSGHTYDDPSKYI